METLVNFISSLADMVFSAFQFLVGTIEGLAYCVKMLIYFTTNIPDYFNWLPYTVRPLIVLVFGVAVTYKILGREG